MQNKLNTPNTSNIIRQDIVQMLDLLLVQMLGLLCGPLILSQLLCFFGTILQIPSVFTMTLCLISLSSLH